MVALFPEDLTWRHYRGAVDFSGVQEAFDAGHEPTVAWYLPEELPEELLVLQVAARAPRCCRRGHATGPPWKATGSL